jgi:hypothetical protein
MAYLVVYFVITYRQLFTLAMGYLQDRTSAGHWGKPAGSDSDIGSIPAVSAVCMQAFVCVMAFQGSS